MGPAYFLLVIGAGGLWSQGWKTANRVLIQPHSKKMLWWCAGFFIPLNFFIYAPILYPWVPKVARTFNPSGNFELKNDVSNELFGWPEAGAEALRYQAEVEAATGRRPFMAGHRYEITAQIWKATMQRTYMLSKTWSHYTFVTTPEEYESLRGQDAIMVANDKYPLEPSEFAKFDSCEPHEFKFYRADELSRIFTIFVCKNFQGVKD